MGREILLSYLDAPNETMRDVAHDPIAIVAVLNEVEKIHEAFLEALIDLQAPEDPPLYYETNSEPDYEYDDDPFS